MQTNARLNARIGVLNKVCGGFVSAIAELGQIIEEQAVVIAEQDGEIKELRNQAAKSNLGNMEYWCEFCRRSVHPNEAANCPINGIYVHDPTKAGCGKPLAATPKKQPQVEQ